MGRTFTAASSMYGQHAAAPVTAEPLTMACFFNQTTTAAQVMMAIGNGSGTSRWQLALAGAAFGAQAISVNSAGTAAIALTSAGYSTGVVNHAAAVFSGAASRTAFLNGANKVTETTSITVSGVNQFNLATRVSGGTRGLFFGGSIFAPCVWNVALNDDEIAMLAAGYHPSLVRPESIVALWDCDQSFSPEPDHWGRYDLTLTASPTYADDPPLIYPQGIVQAVYAPGGAPPAAGNRRRRFIICGAAA